MANMYTLVPRPIYEFGGLDLITRCTFGLIFDRWMLSIQPDNVARFKDNFGVYCLYSRPALAYEVGVSLPTLRKAIKVLEARDLIYTRVARYGDSVRYYITRRALDSLDQAHLAPAYHMNPNYWAEFAAKNAEYLQKTE